MGIVTPYRPGKPLYRRLQRNKRCSIQPQPPVEPVVVSRHANCEPPRNKRDDAKEDREPVTHKPGAEVKAGLQLKFLAAYGAFFRHLHRAMQVVRVGINEQVTLPAARTLISQYTPEQARPGITPIFHNVVFFS